MSFDMLPGGNGEKGNYPICDAHGNLLEVTATAVARPRVATILPLNTSIEEEILEEIADILWLEYSHRYGNFPVGARITLPTSGSYISFVTAEPGGEYVPGFRLPDPEDSTKVNLFDYIEAQYDSPVLAVTDLPIIDPTDNRLHGGAHLDKPIGIVRTHPKLRHDKSMLMHSLATHALHELGHMHGLDHHDTYNPSGLHCPMISTEALALIYHAEMSDPTLAEKRDVSYCTACRRDLR